MVVVGVVVVVVVVVVVTHNASISDNDATIPCPVLLHSGSELPPLDARYSASHKLSQSHCHPLSPSRDTRGPPLSVAAISGGSDVSIVSRRSREDVTELPVQAAPSMTFKGLPLRDRLWMFRPTASSASILAIWFPESIKARTTPGSLPRASPGKSVSWLSESRKATRLELVKASALMVARRLWSMMREVMGSPVRKPSGRLLMRL